MTRRGLYTAIAFVSFLYLLMIGTFFTVDPESDFAQQLRFALPLLIALPAAFLVECFRRRGALQEALRELYYSVVDDLQTAIRYTKRDHPTEDEYFDTLGTISISIDRVRAHFKNITRRGLKPNLYPIEGVKTFYTWIEFLGGGDQWKGEAAAAQTRAALIDLWKNKVREPLLSELDRHEPDKFLSPYAGDELWQLPPQEYLRTEAQALAKSED